jgi:hypothetical protein
MSPRLSTARCCGTRLAAYATHEMPGSEVIGGTGEAETELVASISQGLLLIAQYLVAKEHFQADRCVDGRGYG